MLFSHGIYRKQNLNREAGTQVGREEIAVFRYGIRQIFAGLATSDITPVGPNLQRARQLLLHFTTISQRLVFTVQHVNMLMQSMANIYNLGPIRMEIMAKNFEAECHADHILSYLSTWVDDIALAIVLATGYVPQRGRDSMGDLKNRADQVALLPVASLLQELDQPGSWWELAFKTRVGGRQRLVHNQAFVQFQGSAADGTSLYTSPHRRPAGMKTRLHSRT